MRVRILAAITVFVVLLGVYIIGIRMYSPRLIGMTPAPEARHVSPRAPLALEFSQSLTPDSVIERLKIDPPTPGSYDWQGQTLIFTPDQPWLNGRTIEVKLESGARAAGFPWLSVRESTGWRFKVSNDRLAYLWPSDGPADLYALDPISGDIQRLTVDENILDYTFSLDGGWVYLSADDNQGGSYIARIDLSDLPASPDQPYQAEKLTACPSASCQLPQVSPDGRWVSYERVSLQRVGAPESRSIWLYDVRSGRSTQVSPAGQDASGPAWSPTGLLAYYDHDRQAYLVGAPESEARLSLPNQTGEPGIWQPDGGAFVALEVLIESSRLLDPGGTSHLVRYELSESGDVLKTQMDISRAFDLEDNDPAFSPDGARLAFSRRYLDPVRWTPGRQLWVMDADGSQARQLTDDSAYHHYAFDWSLDGAQIAFVRFDPTLLTQPPELWLIHADGSEALKLLNGGFAPRWMP